MSVFYDGMIELAERLIREKGQTVTLRNFTATAGADPAKPWHPGANVTVDQSVSAVFLDYAQRYIDGTQIHTGDQRVLMPPQTIAKTTLTAPEVEGLVIRGSETWKVVRVITINPAGDPVLYDLQVRR